MGIRRIGTVGILEDDDYEEFQPVSPRVLIAEDDDSMRHLLADTLRRAGCDVIELHNGADLLRMLGHMFLRVPDGRPIDLVITDFRMPLATGLDALEILRARDWSLPVILITAFGDEAVHEEARRLGAVAVFDKPFPIDELRSAALRVVSERV